ncbi:hypothetical protein K488DRAFT_88475 [Vararia minispora EC-137]|uniref:Uncharacterized protein n=1 Tax=Vararia minispora EC-137 TaxID=1314806 RepID=A0ACB8QDG0_9AGAM|nr:hypothetical protein K488DRAFT_88475 [Vararia minispora EC-137]
MALAKRLDIDQLYYQVGPSRVHALISCTARTLSKPHALKKGAIKRVKQQTDVSILDDTVSQPSKRTVEPSEAPHQTPLHQALPTPRRPAHPPSLHTSHPISPRPYPAPTVPVLNVPRARRLRTDGKQYASAAYVAARGRPGGPDKEEDLSRLRIDLVNASTIKLCTRRRKVDPTSARSIEGRPIVRAYYQRAV